MSAPGRWRIGNGVHESKLFEAETMPAAVLAAVARGYLVRGDVAEASSVDGEGRADYRECGSFRVTEAGTVVEL